MRTPLALVVGSVLFAAVSSRSLWAQTIPAPAPGSCEAATECLSCAAMPDCGWCPNERTCTHAGPGAAPCVAWIPDALVCKAPGDASMTPGAPPSGSANAQSVAPTAPAPPVLSPEAQATVQAHAAVRAAVSVQPLQWSAQLSSVATDWAQQLCARSQGGRAVLQHRPNNRFGENIYWMGGAPTPPGVEVAVRSWADERRFYDANNNRCSGGQCGHYTQLVWRNSRSVGCGSATCAAGTFWVCNYDPPGNFIGQRPY